MKYKSWLKSKNLSNTTIAIYLREYEKWNDYLDGREPTKKLFVKYINLYKEKYKANSIRLVYSTVLSIFKYQKKWKLINECRDIKLPKLEFYIRNVIKNEEYEKYKNNINFSNFIDKRNFLIFSFLYYTGLRVSELLQIDKRNLYDKNKILIFGKGNKNRVIYLNSFLMNMINSWQYTKIAVNKNGKNITCKQINLIIKKIGFTYFNKNITAHSLRRSFATNLLRNNINLEIVRRTLGHSNINTTSKYLHFTDDEIINELEKILK